VTGAASFQWQGVTEDSSVLVAATLPAFRGPDVLLCRGFFRRMRAFRSTFSSDRRTKDRLSFCLDSVNRSKNWSFHNILAIGAA
jgi:hypothetical protein